MSGQRGRKHVYLTDEEPEAREIKGLAQNHTVHHWGLGVGLELVHRAPAPKLLAPTPTPLPPLGAMED